MNHEKFLSTAAAHYQESAIRRTGALAGRVPDLISFAPGYPAPELFPWDDLKAIASELLDKHDGNVLQYGATRGYRPLIERLVRTLSDRGVKATADDIIVTTGSQQGLDLIGRVLLDPGDVVLVELPTYSGAIAAFHNLQASLAGVPQDDEGVSIEALERTVAELRAAGRRVRVVYVTPNFQNPTGLLMSSARRRALLDAAIRHDLLIVEDDPYGSLYFEDTTTPEETRPIKAGDGEGRVVYLGSISKTLVPGFRVAWLVAPPAIAHRVELAKQAADLCTGVFDQRIVHAALERGMVDAIAPRLRAHYQEKRTVMEEALGATLGDRVRWSQPRGGFFLWAEFDEGIDDRELFDRAVDQKVSFVIGSAFYVDGPPSLAGNCTASYGAASASSTGRALGDARHRCARLSFSAPSADRIREGVSRLRAALDEIDARRATA